MAVANTDTIRAETGNGVKVAFDFSFKIFNKTDLIVFKETAADVFTPQVLDVDYTVIFDTDAETGTVTYTTAPATGLDSVIIRDTAETQGLSLPREKPLPEKQLENALDRLTLIVQEHTEQLARAPLLPITPPVPAETVIKDRITSRALKWFDNTVTGKFEIVSSSSDPDDVTGTATLSGPAATRPVSPPNSILHWYSTDDDQYDVWLLAAGKWFEAVG